MYPLTQGTNTAQRGFYLMKILIYVVLQATVLFSKSK